MNQNKPLVLDTGPLGMIAHPRPNPEIARWLLGTLSRGWTVCLPEIADYELRRNLLAEGLTASLTRLDGLKTTLEYLPLTTEIMQQAAGLWAQARKAGRPTGDPRELDGDVILAALAISVGGIVVTGNIGHLAQFVEARTWQEIPI